MCDLLIQDNIIDKGNGWIVEYSPSQKAFNTEETKYVLKRNIMHLILNIPSDWILVGSFNSRKDADKAYEILSRKRDRILEEIEKNENINTN